MVDHPRSSTSNSKPRLGSRRQGDQLPVRARTLWVLAGLAMVLDIALTGIGLSMGLAERNHVARLFIREFGLIGGGALLKGFALTVGYASWRLLPWLNPDAIRHRYLVPVGLALPSWAAVGINAVTILVAA